MQPKQQVMSPFAGSAGIDFSTNRIQRLNGNNYFGWSQSMETFFTQQKLLKFISYGSFQEWYLNFHIDSDREIEYKIFKNEIQNELGYDEDGIRVNMRLLSKEFSSDLSLWSREKSKEQTRWSVDEEQVRGYIRGSVDSTIWNQIKECSSPYNMWVTLKEVCLTNESSNILVLFKNVFEAKPNKGESLVNFLGRVAVIANRLEELGEPISQFIL